MTILYGTKLNSFSWPEGRSAGIALRKITQDVRKYAEENGLTEDEALQQGLEQKAVEFVETGGDIYRKA